MSTITREELKAKLDRSDNFHLLEALPKPNFDEAHLPGAKNLPPDQLESLAATLIPSKDAEVVLYCTGPTCTFAPKAAVKLAELGYKNVRTYVGGKVDWRAAGLTFAEAR